MKFLVILICLALNHLWLGNRDRFDDRWFFRFRERMEAAARRAAPAAWWPAPALIYALPLLLLGALLQLAREQAFGLPTMLLHILVVLVAFDRVQPGRLARDFLDIWSGGDEESARAFLRREFRDARKRDFANREEIADCFRKYLVYRSFERMFAQFFWYMAAGPAGVLASYISYQLRDSGDDKTHPRAAATVAVVIHALEWIPLRLLALSFALTGNFVHCFNQLKGSLLAFGPKVDNAGLLYGFADSALSGIAERGDADAGADAAAGGKRQAREIESLQALLERCQLLWLGLLALFTIFGPVV